jgi:hypothetical protein
MRLDLKCNHYEIYLTEEGKAVFQMDTGGENIIAISMTLANPKELFNLADIIANAAYEMQEEINAGTINSKIG